MATRKAKKTDRGRDTRMQLDQEVSMTAPTPVRLDAYTGTLVLDNSSQQALLQQRSSDGSTIQTLMMLDTSPTGGFDPSEVTAAWQYFSTKPGVQAGDTIVVYGFWNYPPNSNRPVLHVVRA
jgi:hypothetical protein